MSTKTHDRPIVTQASRAGFALLAVVTALTLTLSISVATTATAAPAAVTTVTAAPAADGPNQMITAGCSGGRCTVWLSKSETAALGRGSVPAPPASLPVQLRAAYYAFAYGHRWFASQYASRNMCSGFRLSIYPWETQGYFGYYC